MLDINKLREDRGGEPDLVRDSQRRRGISPDSVDECIAADKAWSKAKFAEIECNTLIRVKQKLIGEKYKAKLDASELLAEKRILDTERLELSRAVSECEERVHSRLSAIGNLLADDVPGTRNLDTARKNGKCDERLDGIPHHELVRHMNACDFPRGVRVGGHRGYYLRGSALLLNQALQCYATSFLSSRRYAVVQPPVAMRADLLHQLREGKAAEHGLQRLKLPAETCEEALELMHMGEWLRRIELPMWYAAVATVSKEQHVSRASVSNVTAPADAYTPADGLLQVSQHTEVASMCLSAPEEHEEIYNDVLADIEQFYQSLCIPYRVIATHGSQVPLHASREHVLQAWFPISGEYHDMGRVSHSTDYISRRLEIRCDHKRMFDHEKVYTHMIHGLVCCTERLLCCLLETRQDSEGIKIPPVLRPYLGDVEILPFK